MLLYHGSALSTCKSFLAGAELDLDAAARYHIDGELGFYLATSLEDAKYFALRRSPGGVLVYDLSNTAYELLRAAGSTEAAIPGNPPYFEGGEFFVAASAFSLFNDLLKDGEINVRT